MAQAPSILILEDVDSTNAEARRRAEAGQTGPLWIVARCQGEGRGRRGRAWVSETGNLYATLLTTTRKAPAEAAQVTFVAALAVADLICTFVPAPLVTIKWPNDVMIEADKAAGILVESGAHDTGGLWLAVGIGVNLAHAPSGTERPATAIGGHLKGEVRAAPTVAEAIEVLAHHFAIWMDRWDTLGFQPILDAWVARSRGLDQACTARLGHETVSGIADGVAADGSLRLKLADGSMRLISAGDVFFGSDIPGKAA
ncbi:Bifunctional ligase/repressor BirA [Brevundimonas sp. NIBR10]|uniref:biotin--[acetyl-CoA-carboxylase] ligase n=1 Tax=Brevundimonas sp. NIBR10 TaxID=3015997 RepID=UPI0022F16C91|nr:biotin--[acetyl-CoA-carboxylase] ligase [Brevundimonas sp. NIBR10]WGM47363.1 Bifunctional ligase/repressor BirA [Brevundimonas sp. NIBR10]